VVAARYKKDDLLNCWASTSDISGYHAEFHEGHGTVGAGQGRGMAWKWHVMYELALNVQRLWLSENKATGVLRLETIRSDTKTIFVTFFSGNGNCGSSILCSFMTHGPAFKCISKEANKQHSI
jgi:hypothetical protein